MKLLRRLSTLLILLACANPLLAQSAAAISGKIGVVDTTSFEDEKTGITRYTTALQTLAREFSPLEAEVKALQVRRDALQKQISTSATAGVSTAQASALYDEYDKAQRDLSFKSEDAQAKYEKRKQVVLEPIAQDIGTALQEFAKLKGYLLIFDIAKDQAGFLIAIGDDRVNVTKDFITFYNARPATAAPR